MKNEISPNPYQDAPRIAKLYNDYNGRTKESSKRDLLLMYIVEVMEDLAVNELSENDRNKIMEEVVLKIEDFISTSLIRKLERC